MPYLMFAVLCLSSFPMSLGFRMHVDRAVASSSMSSMTMPTAFPVMVGADGGLKFEPNYVEGNIGDVIVFDFRAINHTLTQSTLAQPCTPGGAKFDTGFNQFNPTNSKQILVQYTIATSDPQWFFCAQTKPKSHCEAGMVFAINPQDKMNQFLSAASTKATSNALPAPISQCDAATVKVEVQEASSSNQTPSSQVDKVDLPATITSTSQLVATPASLMTTEPAGSSKSEQTTSSSASGSSKSEQTTSSSASGSALALASSSIQASTATTSQTSISSNTSPVPTSKAPSISSGQPSPTPMVSVLLTAGNNIVAAIPSLETSSAAPNQHDWRILVLTFCMMVVLGL